MNSARSLLLVGFVVLLSACGTIQLGTVHSPAGVTRQQLDVDTLSCKEEARLAVEAGGNQVGDFLLGASLVGIPFAYKKNSSIQRDVFSRCMAARGYKVEAPHQTLSASVGDAGPSLPNYSFPRAPETGNRGNLVHHSLQLPEGWRHAEVPDVLRQRGIFLFALNATKDLAAAMSSIASTDITSFSDYAHSTYASQLSLVSEAEGLGIAPIEIDGRQGYRYRVRGLIDGMRVTYLTTVLTDGSSVIHLNSWTSSPNFTRVEADLEELAHRIDWPVPGP